MRHKLPGRLLRQIFPALCVLCGDAGTIDCFCPACRHDLPRLGPACSRCSEPVGKAFVGGICPRCRRSPPPFRAARAALAYAFPVDAALKSFKFHHQLYYAPAFAELLFGELLRTPVDADALAPVPLHPLRHALRGFNQSVELCRPLARCTGLPVVGNLRRVRPTAPQSGLSAAGRRRNLRNAFAVRGRLRHRRLLIVDDVMTTGETCRQLAATLLDAGADSVHVITVARASSIR